MSKDIIRTCDGREVHVAITRSAIRDQAGHLAGIVHVLRDISAEEELNRLKDEFLSTVSHELRTPLGFIKGYAMTPLLPDAPTDARTTRHCLEVIAEASDELEELVGNLLDMTKIGAGALSVSPTPGPPTPAGACRHRAQPAAQRAPPPADGCASIAAAGVGGCTPHRAGALQPDRQCHQVLA